MGGGSKNIILFIIIVALLAIGYFMFFGKSTDEVLESNIAKRENVEGDVLPVLLELKQIKLDTSFFKEKSFTNLFTHDFTVKLVSQSVGRVNPFAPQGFDAGVSSGAGISTSTQR